MRAGRPVGPMGQKLDGGLPHRNGLVHLIPRLSRLKGGDDLTL